MSLYNDIISVTSKTAGVYIQGVYIETDSTTRVIFGSIQPAKNNDMLALPEGRRNAKAFRVYTPTELNALQSSTNPDQLLIYNEMYEVVTKNTWLNEGLPHYKYIAVLI